MKWIDWITMDCTWIELNELRRVVHELNWLDKLQFHINWIAHVNEWSLHGY